MLCLALAVVLSFWPSVTIMYDHAASKIVDGMLYIWLVDFVGAIGEMSK